MIRDNMACPTPAQPPPRAQHAWKWWIAVVLFLATVLTYLDRQTMSLCGSMICDEFHLSNEQYGQLTASFRWAYALTQLPAGRMADRLPIRLTYALAVGLWSLAGASAAFVFGFKPLLKTRAILGVGETFNWPCATRIVANTFPPADRGLASGIFNSGAAVGSLVAPLAITPIAQHFGWRTAFFAIGALGIFWLGLWLFSTRRHAASQALPLGRPRSGRYYLTFVALFLALGIGLPVLVIEYGSPVANILRGRLAGLGTQSAGLWSWLYRAAWLALAAVMVISIVAKGRKAVALWMLLIVAVTINPCWYFLNEWLPKYMHDQRGLGYVGAGLATMPIFLGADLGNVLSGGLIKLLTGRGWSLRLARGSVLSLCGALIVPVVLIARLESPTAAVILLGMAGMGIASIVGNFTACQQDFSFAHVGLVTGLVGTASNVVSAIANPCIGRYVDQTGNYTLIFLLLGGLPVASVAAIVIFDSIIHGSPKQMRSGERAS